MEFVADYYGSGFPLPLEVKKKPPVSLKAELDYWAARRDTSWIKRPDNIYLFRNNRWYISDCLQVPAPLLRRWYTMRLEQMRRQAAGPIPLAEKIRQQMDWQAEVVTALTPWQIMGGLRGFFAATLFPNAPAELPSEKLVEASPGITKNLFAGYPFLRDVDRLFSQYNTVRFYAGLDASARNALIEGRLSFSGLNPQQQEQAMYLVPKLRILALQRNHQPVYLQLKPRGEGDFQGESGRVRVTLVLPPSDS